jgi:hypothetical protein
VVKGLRFTERNEVGILELRRYTSVVIRGVEQRTPNDAMTGHHETGRRSQTVHQRAHRRCAHPTRRESYSFYDRRSQRKHTPGHHSMSA